MATYYLDSNAAGANDGTSWTDAWTDLANVTGLANGDIVKVEYRHDNPDDATATGYNLGVSFNASTSVTYISVDKDNSDAYRKMTTGRFIDLNSGTLTLNKGFTLIGLIIDTDNLDIGPGTGSSWGTFYLRDCIINANVTGGWLNLCDGHSAVTFLVDVEINFSGNTTGIFDMDWGRLVWQGGSLTNGPTGSYLYRQEGGTAELYNVDLSSVGTTDLFYDDANWQITGVLLKNCKMPASFDFETDLLNGTANVVKRLRAEFCGDGTLTSRPISLNALIDEGGQVFGVTSVNRSSGASDGDNDWSYKVTGKDVDRYRWFRFPVASVEIDDTDAAQTFRVYMAHNAVGGGTGSRLLDSEAWLDITGPDDNASPDAQGYTATNRAAFEATGADEGTSDTGSTWNGTGVGTKEYHDITYTPNLPGIVTIYFNLAINSTVYVCPLVAVNP